MFAELTGLFEVIVMALIIFSVGLVFEIRHERKEKKDKER